jgi:hypothetical protein
MGSLIPENAGEALGVRQLAAAFVFIPVLITPQRRQQAAALQGALRARIS